MTRLFAALFACSSVGCVWIFDRPPGTRISPTTGEDLCTRHYGATVADAVFGTLSLTGGVFGLGLADMLDDGGGGGGRDLFFGVGLIGLAGAAMHYASAGSNDVAECRAISRKR